MGVWGGGSPHPSRTQGVPPQHHLACPTPRACITVLTLNKNPAPRRASGGSYLAESEHGKPTNAPDSPARGVRGLGNFKHWSGTPEGSRYLLQICASVHDSYLRSRDIVVCQYAVANRPAALRWGGLAVHTHVVDGTCLADPMAVLERSVEDGIAKMTGALAGLEDAVAAGRIPETLQTLRRARTDLGDMRELLRRLHVFDPVDRR